MLLSVQKPFDSDFREEANLGKLMKPPSKALGA